MAGINVKDFNMQDSGDYEADCKKGKVMAKQFYAELKHKICHAKYDGMERHALGDVLLGHSITGVQVGFCSELIKQIEPLLLSA